MTTTTETRTTLIGCPRPRRKQFKSVLSEPGETAPELAARMLASPAIRDYLEKAKSAKFTVRFTGRV